MDNQKSMEIFAKAPVSQAVLKNALPAMAAMLMVLIYNLADTFFIGQTHDALQVAAVSLATPVFLMFMAVGTVFGVGGTSVISRAMGEGNIGTVFGAGYYILYFLRGKPSLSINIKDFSLKNKAASGVLAIGVPAALGSVLMSVSQIIINSQMSEYGDMAIAAMGVAMKVVTITGMVCMGLGQGVQPLFGYCVGAKMWERFKKSLRFSVIFALLLSVILTGICYLFINQIVSVFLTEPTAFDYAVQFSRILLTTGFLFGVFYVLTNALQAMGAATAALVINISRQGIIFIPALFILKLLVGMTGLVWAQPAADVLSLIIAYVFYIKTSKKMAS